MRITLISNLFLLFAATTCAASDLETRGKAKTSIYVCTDKFWSGTCKNIEVTAGKCYNMPAAFDQNVSSTGPDQGTFCTLHSSRNCQGGKVIPFTNPGIANFDKYDFENQLRSVRCDFIWGWPKKSG